MNALAFWWNIGFRIPPSTILRHYVDGPLVLRRWHIHLNLAIVRNWFLCSWNRLFQWSVDKTPLRDCFVNLQFTIVAISLALNSLLNVS